MASLSPAAGGVSLLALAPQVVGERELEQRREDEGRAGAHPDVDRLFDVNQCFELHASRSCDRVHQSNHLFHPD